MPSALMPRSRVSHQVPFAHGRPGAHSDADDHRGATSARMAVFGKASARMRSRPAGSRLRRR